MKFDKNFLKRVLSIPSVSYREERVRDFILGFARRRAITVTVGKAGNVYLTKGRIGLQFPQRRFAAHHDGLLGAGAHGKRMARE